MLFIINPSKQNFMEFIFMEAQMLLLTGEKVGEDFPTFFQRAPRLQITFKNRAVISNLHWNSSEVTHECEYGDITVK